MKHEARSTKSETNSKNKKNILQAESGVSGFGIWNLDIVSNFGFRISNFHRKSFGFTMVEIVIMLGIITMVSLVVLVNFPAVTETIFIQRSGQEITGLLRRAQSMSLAVRSVKDPSTGLIRIPRGVGVRFIHDTATMVLFGDLDNNNFYDVGTDAVIATYALERNLKTALATPTRDPITELHVVFASPDASVSILGETPTDDVGQTEGRASIKIITPALSLDRVVEVAITGQISVK
ncbi:MAG: type II secretion system protein [bacterium]|nr:type II secretion system protein [bacterium]